MNKEMAGYPWEADEEIVEMKRKMLIAQEALAWAKEYFFARDMMNAKVHCAPLRLSPITDRVIHALETLESK